MTGRKTDHFNLNLEQLHLNVVEENQMVRLSGRRRGFINRWNCSNTF